MVALKLTLLEAGHPGAHGLAVTTGAPVTVPLPGGVALTLRRSIQRMGVCAGESLLAKQESFWLTSGYTRNIANRLPTTSNFGNNILNECQLCQLLASPSVSSLLHSLRQPFSVQPAMPLWQEHQLQATRQREPSSHTGSFLARLTSTDTDVSGPRGLPGSVEAWLYK